MSILTVKDSTLAGEIGQIRRDLAGLKTSQAYGLAQVKSDNTFAIRVPSYLVSITQGGQVVGQVREVAATFLFRGSLPTKVAIGTIDCSATGVGAGQFSHAWSSFMPTDEPNYLRVGQVWQFSVNDTQAAIEMVLHANMPGSFELEKTYAVYLP